MAPGLRGPFQFFVQLEIVYNNILEEYIMFQEKTIL